MTDSSYRRAGSEVILSRRMRRSLLPLAALLALLGLEKPAAATGMQGHVWSSQCAVETLPAGDLRTLLEANPLRLDNGSFFPDSGYAAKHDYGETAHWEQFVEGYVQWLRATYPKPMQDPAAAPHVAFLMGAASHGLVDQTFDILFMDKVREVDGPTDDLDMSMDIFLAARRKYVPDFDYSAKDLVAIFGEHVGLAVPESEITEGMDLARAGQGVVAEFLWKDDEARGKQYPWARAHYLDPRVPGGYPWGALAVAGYWQNIVRRLEGDTSADALVVGTDPAPNGAVRGRAAGKVDAYLTLFVGQGLKRSSITASSFYVLDAAGAVVETEIRLRGDEWATTLQLRPKADWAPDAKYTLVLDTTVETLSGTHPSKRFELPFTTTVAPAGDEPPSPCPKTMTAHPRAEAPEEPIDAGAPTANAAPTSDSGGCASHGRAGGGGVAALLLAALAAHRVRRFRT